jgi:hypothetical protein
MNDQTEAEREHTKIDCWCDHTEGDHREMATSTSVWGDLRTADSLNLSSIPAKPVIGCLVCGLGTR